MTIEETKEEIMRQLMEKAEIAKYKSETNKSWFRRWNGIYIGIQQSIEIIEDIYKEVDE